MNAIDFSPLFRTAIGFDRLASMLQEAHSHEESYPPYNIELTGENQYRITMAVAGFSDEELTVEVKESVLSVSGRKKESATKQNFLHRGIATRAFERRFQLADHVRIEGANMEHGLLHIDLVREIPEAAKPRQIAITTNQQKYIDSSSTNEE